MTPKNLFHEREIKFPNSNNISQDPQNEGNCIKGEYMQYKQALGLVI